MNAVPSRLVIPDSYRSNFGPFYLQSPHAFLSRCSLCSPAVRSRIFRAPFPGRIPFRASPLRCRLANASGRIEFNIVLFMDWSFASGCSQPRLSTTQLPSATNRPVLLSDGDFHPIIGAYSQAHIYSRFAAKSDDEDDCGVVAAPKPPRTPGRNIPSRSRNKSLSLTYRAKRHHSGSRHAQLPGRVHRKAPAENIRAADMT